MKNLPGFAATAALAIAIGLIILGGGAYVAVHPEVLEAPVAESELTLIDDYFLTNGTSVFKRSVRNDGCYDRFPDMDGTCPPEMVEGVDAKTFKRLTPYTLQQNGFHAPSLHAYYVDATHVYLFSRVDDLGGESINLAKIDADHATFGGVENQLGVDAKDKNRSYLYGKPIVATASGKVSIAWKFDDLGERDGIPYTRVTAVVNGQSHVTGEYQGSCREIGAEGGVDGKGLIAGELSAAQCWFAGGGNEIGLFAHEDGGHVIMVGDLDEGTAESAGVRGNFEIKLDLPLR